MYIYILSAIWLYVFGRNVGKFCFIFPPNFISPIISVFYHEGNVLSDF